MASNEQQDTSTVTFALLEVKTIGWSVEKTNNGQETSMENQASIPRDTEILQPTVEFHCQDQIVFALTELKSNDRWSGEMANNGQIPRNIETLQPTVEFYGENQIAFALLEINTTNE